MTETHTHPYPPRFICLLSVCVQIAREHGIRFFETSAKANINIEKAFLTLAEDILRKVRVHLALAVSVSGLTLHLVCVYIGVCVCFPDTCKRAQQ